MLVHISNSQLNLSFPYPLVLWEPFLNITEIPANLLCLPSPGGLQALHVRTLDFRRPQGDLSQGRSPRCRRLAVSRPETDGRAGFQRLSVLCSGHIYKAFHTFLATSFAVHRRQPTAHHEHMGCLPLQLHVSSSPLSLLSSVWLWSTSHLTSHANLWKFF